MKDGLTDADRAVIEAARTGEGLIEVTPEMFTNLATAARETMDYFQGTFLTMTLEQASFVRSLRCDDGYSWRAVAQECDEAWDGDWGSNQLAGMAICERAAGLFGETYMQEPWN